MQSLPEEKEYPDAGAIVLLNEAYMEVFKMGEHSFSEMRHHTVIKILNHRGYKYANVLLPYNSDTEISKIRARTILSDGQIVPLRKNQIYDTNLYPNYIFYSDLRAKRFTMPAVEEGCIVEYTWHKAVKNFTFWTLWQFQKEDPVLISRYTIRCPNNWDINWKAYQVDVDPVTEKGFEGQKVDHTWEVRNLPGLIPETAMPNGLQNIPHIMFSPLGINTWDDVAVWYHNTIADRMKASGYISRFTEKLLVDLSDPNEKLKQIFEFVRDHIRYVAIEIGIGGYQPHFAEDVLKNRYGDCKDMVSLLIAMSNVVGIEVHPVLISTWYNGDLDTSLVSQAHFDHMIAVAQMADGSEIWMDPTEKFVNFGELPWYDKNRMVIVMNSKKAILKRTPPFHITTNSILRQWTIHFHESGDMKGVLKTTIQGAHAMDMRHRLDEIHPSQITDYFVKDLLSKIPTAVPQNIITEQVDSIGNPIQVIYEFTIPENEQPLEYYFSFRPASLSGFNSHVLFTSQERYSPIVFRYPVWIQDSICVSYPTTWTPVSTIMEDSLSTPYGICSWEMRKDGEGQIIWIRTSAIHDSMVFPQEYAAFRSFLNQIVAYDQKAMVFKIDK